MQELQHRFASFLGRTPMRHGNGEDEAITVAEWSPLVDVIEDDREYLIKAELPEVKKDDVKVTIEHGTLTVAGNRQSEKEEKNRKFHRIERLWQLCAKLQRAGRRRCRASECRVQGRRASGASPEECLGQSQTNRSQGGLMPVPFTVVTAEISAATMKIFCSADRFRLPGISIRRVALKSVFANAICNSAGRGNTSISSFPGWHRCCSGGEIEKTGFFD